MKLGLITIHETQNYGSLLQTYSLYKVIENLGYDIELIDYKNSKIYERELPINLRKSKKLKDIIKKYLWGNSQLKKYNNIKKFIKENIKISDKYDINNISNANNIYDIFITGSDIVWGLNITGSDFTYFLDFTDDKKKRVSFSSSVGTKWEIQEQEKVKKLLSRYTYINVREKLACDWIKELFGLPCKVTCDPTMMFKPEFWKTFVKKSEIIPKEKYVLIYARNPDDKNISDGIKYARKHNMKAYFINFYTPVKGTKTIKPTTVEEWLSLIYYSDTVFSASYHGLLFSLYFNKNVFYYNRGEKSRMISLANDLNISYREGTDSNVINDKPINYEFVSNAIDKIRDESLEIIEKDLESLVKNNDNKR